MHACKRPCSLARANMCACIYIHSLMNFVGGQIAHWKCMACPSGSTSVYVDHNYIVKIVFKRTFSVYSGNFRGENIRGIRGWRSDHEYFTHKWSDLAYLYLHCKQQPRKYYPRNVSILLNHEYFVPRKLPAIRYMHSCMHVYTVQSNLGTVESILRMGTILTAKIGVI